MAAIIEPIVAISTDAIVPLSMLKPFSAFAFVSYRQIQPLGYRS